MLPSELTFVDLSDPVELQDLARTIQRFAPQLHVERGSEPAFDRSDFTSIAGLGLCGMHLPESVGGLGLGTLAQATAIAILAEAQLGPAIYLSVHQMVARIIAAADTTRSHQKQLDALIAGSELAAFCLTEAAAGSDAQALRTTAVRTPDGYTLTGEKIYISSAPVADVFLVFARVHSLEGPIGAFLLARNTPGLEVGPAEHKMGCSGAPIASVHLNECHVPHSALVGEEDTGFRIAMRGLQAGRVSIAAAACGVGIAALDLAVRHAQDRRQFGSPIADFQGIQFLLADCAMHLQASILLTRHAATALDRGDSSSFSASSAKCFATDTAMRVTTDCVQVLGGAGYLADYGAERLMRDAKMLQIVEGTNQIQRILVSRALLQR